MGDRPHPNHQTLGGENKLADESAREPNRPQGGVQEVKRELDSKEYRLPEESKQAQQDLTCEVHDIEGKIQREANRPPQRTDETTLPTEPPSDDAERNQQACRDGPHR